VVRRRRWVVRRRGRMSFAEVEFKFDSDSFVSYPAGASSSELVVVCRRRWVVRRRGRMSFARLYLIRQARRAPRLLWCVVVDGWSGSSPATERVRAGSARFRGGVHPGPITRE